LVSTPAQQQRWLDYLGLIAKWNRVYNLTSMASESMLVGHLLDSLSIAPYVTGMRILDVGSGAGLPGLPLAILFPEKSVELVDTVAKKVRFMRQAVQDLGLKNVDVHHVRVEAFSTEKPFDQIVSRAFTALDQFLALTGPLLASGGQWLAMKGALPEAELAAIGENFAYTVHPLKVPGLDARRHLVVITRNP
jgi:16S rRNA (guanine527-N7)-methyltransferase